MLRKLKKLMQLRKKLKKALESDDLETINSASEKLTEIVQQLSVKLYEQAAQDQGAGGAEGASAGGPNKDNVVDADYEVVDEDKKNN